MFEEQIMKRRRLTFGHTGRAEDEDRPLCLVEDLTVRRINDHLTFGQLDTMVSSSSLLATN
jgi:hypothetical protein